MGQKDSRLPACGSNGLRGAMVGTAVKLRHQDVSIPSVEPWQVLFSDTVESWQQYAEAYGFTDYPYRCTDTTEGCDRDQVCLKKARAVLHQKTQLIEIQRCNRSPSLVSYADHWEVRVRLAESYQLNQIIAAMRDELVLVVLYIWDSLQYQAFFLLIDTATDEIVSYFQSPMPNMSIVECKISPDGSRVGVLFYSKKDKSLPFQYSLYLFSAESGEVGDVVECNKEVRPYVTFDPRYGSSRIAIVNYSNAKTGHTNSLVNYDLDRGEVIATSHVTLSLICGIGYFCANFSRDGNFLVLQKIMENMNRGYCYTDSYVFDSNSLRLLKHFYANLHPLSTVCHSNYAPTFSKCSGRMCVLSEDNTGEPRLYISVYQLPNPLSLQQMCRRTIVKTIISMADVDSLPLPQKLKLFLKFLPQEP